MNSGSDRDASVERLLQRTLARGQSSGAGTPAECPDAEMLAAWVDGGLDQRAVALLESHASECARCQALLAVVARTAPEPAPPVWLETWRRGWGFRWLVPLAAGAAAAVIIWVAVPGERGNQPSDLPDQASAKLSDAAPPALPPASPAERADRFSPPVAPPELKQQAAAKSTTAAKDEASSAPAPAREFRKETAPAAPQASAPAPAAEQAQVADKAKNERLDASDTRARDGLAAAGAAARPQSSINETGALSRQTAKTATLEIASPDPSVRWRIGAGGTVERTTTAGSTWEAVPTGVAGELTAGAAPSRAVCWLVGRAGTVLLSTDGRTFRRLPFPQMVDLAAVQAVDAQRATLTTADGRTFRTTDGGLTWN